MLRVEIRRENDLTTFSLEGRLMGAWVQEFEKCWRDLDAGPLGGVCVDLSGVTFIDARGRELLTQIRRTGATLLASGCMTRAIVWEIEAQVEGSKGG